MAKALSLLAVAVSAMAAQEMESNPVPTIFWSGSETFTKSAWSQTMSASDVQDVLKRVMGVSQLENSHVQANADKPEIVLALIQNQAVAGHFSFVQSAVAAAPSSLVVPYTYFGSSGTGAALRGIFSGDDAAALSHESPVLIAESSRGVSYSGKMSSAKLVQQIASMSITGDTKFIALYLDGADSQKIAEEIFGAVQRRVGSKWVAVLTSQEFSVAPLQMHFPSGPQVAAQHHARRLSQADPAAPAKALVRPQIYITADIFSGLLVMLMILLIFFTGFCTCLGNLQTPGRYEKEYVALGKLE